MDWLVGEKKRPNGACLAAFAAQYETDGIHWPIVR